MKKIVTTTLVFITLIAISSCSNDNDVENSLIQQEKVIVEKTSSRMKTRAAYEPKEGLSIENKDLYSIKYKDINLKNIPLRIEEVNMLRSASSISAPIPVSVKGYSEWTVRTNGTKGGNWYNRTFSSKDKKAIECGIAPGVYTVRDVWLWQTYTLPTPLAIVFNNNDYPDYTKMGWEPETLKTPGFTWSLSGAKVTLKTAATLIKYTIGGAETHKTYPVKDSNLEWNFYYITVSY